MLTNVSFVMSNNTNLVDLSIKTLSNVKIKGGWALSVRGRKSGFMLAVIAKFHRTKSPHFASRVVTRDKAVI
jgi:hypothetical protein